MTIRRPSLALAGLSLAATAALGAPPDLIHRVFDGKFRRVAKTKLPPGPAREYASVQEFVDQVVTPLNDQAVRQQFPAVFNKTADRVAPERHKVRVHALLYAVKLEGDEDLHCILGDIEPTPYITAEVSGLAAPQTTGTLVRVREQLRSLIGETGLQKSKSRYFRPEPPVPVMVTGSLFYDTEHDPGQIGPNASGPGKPARKAVTQWEIHPVHSMVRDPGP
jgi:hypothetical protein